jgi:hypothetical protein
MRSPLALDVSAASVAAASAVSAGVLSLAASVCGVSFELDVEAPVSDDELPQPVTIAIAIEAHNNALTTFFFITNPPCFFRRKKCDCLCRSRGFFLLVFSYLFSGIKKSPCLTKLII